MADNAPENDSQAERSTAGRGPLRGIRNRTGGPSGPGGPHLRPTGRQAAPSEQIDQELLKKLDREEPLSIAEELDKAAERVRRSGGAIAKATEPDQNVHIADLQQRSTQELMELAEAEGIENSAGLKKQDLIFRILKQRLKLEGMMVGQGTLEILPDGFGFLRSPDYHYLSCPDDIYVSPSQIRRFNLRNGNTVTGTIRPPKENERYFALLRVESINGEDPNLDDEYIDEEDDEYVEYEGDEDYDA